MKTSCTSEWSQSTSGTYWYMYLLDFLHVWFQLFLQFLDGGVVEAVATLRDGHEALGVRIEATHQEDRHQASFSQSVYTLYQITPIITSFIEQCKLLCSCFTKHCRGQSLQHLCCQCRSMRRAQWDRQCPPLRPHPDSPSSPSANVVCLACTCSVWNNITATADNTVCTTRGIANR